MGVGRQGCLAGSRPRGKTLAGGRTMAVPGRQHAACLALPKPEVAACEGGGVVNACAWGLFRSSSYRVEPLLQGQRPVVAQPKKAKLGRRGPGLSRRKTSQGLQIAALSFPPTPSLLLLGVEKKSSASSRGRMQTDAEF